MKTREELIDFVENGGKEYLANILIDLVIFGYHERQLKVLVGKYNELGGLGLPGGFIKKSERLEDAAQRILTERTELDKVYLQQFHVFGDTPFRVNRVTYPQIPSDNWLSDRQIAVGYFALVDYEKVVPEPDIFIESYQWVDVNKIPKLLFDHDHAIRAAVDHLRIHLYHKPIGLNLLEKKFTLPEIQSLYETILDRKLDRRNFPKKLFSLGLIKDTREVKKIGQHRSPKLYSFDVRNYNKALKEGIVLVI